MGNHEINSNNRETIEKLQYSQQISRLQLILHSNKIYLTLMEVEELWDNYCNNYYQNDIDLFDDKNLFVILIKELQHYVYNKFERIMQINDQLKQLNVNVFEEDD